jgi:hypothetical protein
MACSAAPRYEAQLGRAARQLSAAADGAELRSVAVVDFTTLDGRLDLLGRYLAISLGTALKEENPQLTLCDRDALEQMLEELKLQTTGLVQEDQIAEVGRGCGAAGIVFGRHLQMDRQVEVKVKLLDVESHEVLAAMDLQIPDSPGFDELRRRAVPLPWSEDRSGHSSTPRRNLPQTAQLGAVEVTLESCTFLQYQLVCNLRMTNTSEAAVGVDVLASTHLVDNQNREHQPSEVWLDGRPRSTHPKLSTTLAAQQTAAIQVEFESVPRVKKKAQLLQVDLGGAGAARFLDFAFDRDEL